MREALVKGVALLILFGVLLTGCETMQANPRTTVGAVGGATVGGLIAGAAGGNPSAIAASVIGGALLGGIVGNVLDDRDKRLQSEAAQKALETAPTGRPVAWQNPDTGHAGTIQPTRTYQTASGSPCREYQSTVTIEGKPELAHGTACREPDGTWKIVR